MIVKESVLGDSVKIQGQERRKAKMMCQRVNLYRDTATSLPSAQLVYPHSPKITKKVKCIMANSCHALHDYYAYMRTGTRLRALSCRTQRYRKSLVPNSIHVTNNR